MSFAATLGSRPGAKPKLRLAEPGRDSFENLIKARVEEMQNHSRGAKENLDRLERGLATPAFNADVVNMDVDDVLARMHRAAQDTQRLFREWTAQMAGEPAERHRKRFVYEKLQRAFDEETAVHEEIRERAAALQPLAVPKGVPHFSLDDDDDDDAPGIAGASTPRGEGTAEVDLDVVDIVKDDDTLNLIVQEREEGIRRVQNQVSQVNQMFRDLATIVVEQGEQLNTIESQAESAAENTVQASKELKKAVAKQGSLKDRLMILLILVTTFVCFTAPQGYSSNMFAAGISKKVKDKEQYAGREPPAAATPDLDGPGGRRGFLTKNAGKSSALPRSRLQVY